MSNNELRQQSDQDSHHKRAAFSMSGKLLGLFLLLALAPLLTHFYISVDTSRKALIKEAGAGISMQAELAMEQLRTNLSHSQKHVLNWSSLPNVESVLRAAASDESLVQEVNDLFVQYARVYGVYDSITLADEQGNVVAASQAELLGANVSSSDWFFETQAYRQSRVGSFKLDANIDNYGVPVSAPVLYRQNDETKVGVINAYYSWRELQLDLDSLKVNNSRQNHFGFLLLVDGDGFVLSAPEFLLYRPEGADYTGSLDVDQLNGEIAKLMPGMGLGRGYKMVSLRGRPAIVAYSTVMAAGAQKDRGMISHQNWRVLIFRDAAAAVSAETELLQKMILVVVITALLVLLLSIVVSRHFTKPIVSLIKRLKELNSGNLDVSLQLEGTDEYAMLGRAFDGMRVELKQHINELSTVNSRYGELVNSIAGVVWEGRGQPFQFSFLSQQVYDVCGYKAGWLLTNPQAWTKIFHPDDIEKVTQTLDSLQVGESVVIEYRVIHKSGRIIWLKNFMSAVEKEGQDNSIRGVAFDITDVKAAEAEVQEARDVALSTAQSRSDFLATMSHELRTPVNGMMGMLELMDEGKIDARELQFFSLALTSGRQLINLLDDILDYTKVENGGLRYEKVPFDIREFMESVVSLMASAARAKNLDISLVLERDIPQVVKSDPTRLRQVLVNLVSNAVKFTDAGSVCVWAEVRSDNMLWVEVRDTGIGISPTRHEVLFEPFVLADASSTRSNRGCGLGLYLTKRIVEGLGGSIIASSVEDTGSSFCFEVPVEIVTPALTYPDFLESREKAVVIGAREATLLSLQALLERQNIFTVVENGEMNVEAFLGLARKHQARYFFIDGSVLNAELVNAWLSLEEAERPKLLCLGTSTIMSALHKQLTADIQIPITLKGLVNALKIANDVPGAELSESSVPAVVGEPAKSGSVALSVLEQSTGKKNLRLSLPSSVLLVDDNLVNLKVASAMLNRLGLEVETAADGQEAVEKASAKVYPIIFMDCQMPVMDGFDATRNIRQLSGEHGTPLIIAITANAMEGDRELCLAAGMDEYITKPVKMNVLAETIARCMPSAAMATS